MDQHLVIIIIIIIIININISTYTFCYNLILNRNNIQVLIHKNKLLIHSFNTLRTGDADLRF